MKSKYIEKEAQLSGDDASMDENDENDSYEKGSFVVSDEEEDGDDDVRALYTKQQSQSPVIPQPAMKKKKTESKTVYKPQGNKSMDIRHVPKEPVKTQSSAPPPKFHWSIVFTNARFAQNFWEVASKALPYLFFHIETRDDYCGLRLEAHDTPPTMAIKSQMECIIEEGVDDSGNKITRESLNGQHFCVKSKSLMRCFKCCTLKDSPLRLIKMNDQDGVIFEASTDESDVRTRYLLPFYSKTPSSILQKISPVSDIQIKMATHVLQKLGDIATNLESDVLKFELSGTENESENITRNKLTVSFDGDEIKGAHTFYLTTKKTNTNGTNEYEPVSTVDIVRQWNLLSSNSYNANKFKLFVSNLDIKWCMVGLSTKDEGKPLIIIADSAETGEARTSHSVFISPQHSEEA